MVGVEAKVGPEKTPVSYRAPLVLACDGVSARLALSVGIDKNEKRNEREIASALALAKRYSNVNAIVVGNEVTLRAEKTADELIEIIKRVKRQSPVPVTTGATS